MKISLFATLLVMFVVGTVGAQIPRQAAKDANKVAYAAAGALGDTTTGRFVCSGANVGKTPDGYLFITAGHCFEDDATLADAYEVTYTDTLTAPSYPAKVLDVDADDDLAILDVHTSLTLPVLEIGDFNEAQATDSVSVSGYPLGIAKLFLRGTVSANILANTDAGVRKVPTLFIQCSGIEHGASGSAVIFNGKDVAIILGVIRGDAGPLQGMGATVTSVAQTINPIVPEINEYLQTGKIAHPFHTVTKKPLDNWGGR